MKILREKITGVSKSGKDYDFTKYYLCSNDESVKLLLLTPSDENGKNAFELLISLIESKDKK